MPTTTPPTTTELPFVSPESLLSKLADAESDISAAVRAAAPGGSLRFAPALTLSTVPAVLDSSWGYQHAAYTQDNVSTLPDGTQHWVGINADKKAVISKRNVDLGTDWSTPFDLSTIAGDPFQPQVADSHNTFAHGVDVNGRVIVAGNMHENPMRAAYTTNPNDLTAWTVIPPKDATQDQCTYVSFFTALDGTLYRYWRDGAATQGNVFYDRWNPTTLVFENQVTFMNGVVSGEGPYPWRIAVSREGKWGVWFCWRAEAGADTNNDFCYVESVDNGATWRRADGTPQTVPITHANAQVVVAAQTGDGLLNQGGDDFDIDGHTHAGIQLYDANGVTQIHHVYWNGSAFVNDQVTRWHETVVQAGQTTLDLVVARPQVVCSDAGRTLVITRTRGEGLGGRPVCIDVTPGAGNNTFPILDMDLEEWEPAIDSRALRGRNELTMFVGSILSPANSRRSWERQSGHVLTLALDKIDEVAARRTRLPTIRTVKTYYVGPEVTLTNTADANIATFGIPQIARQQMGPRQKYFMRWSARLTLNSPTTSGTYYFNESPDSGGVASDTYKVGEIYFQSGMYAGMSTPWVPLPGTPYRIGGIDRDTRLIMRGYADNAAGIKFGAWTVEIGVLEV